MESDHTPSTPLTNTSMLTDMCINYLASIDVPLEHIKSKHIEFFMKQAGVECVERTKYYIRDMKKFQLMTLRHGQ